jgi:hypothetical protein
MASKTYQQHEQYPREAVPAWEPMPHEKIEVEEHY